MEFNEINFGGKHIKELRLQEDLKLAHATFHSGTSKAANQEIE